MKATDQRQTAYGSLWKPVYEREHTSASVRTGMGGGSSAGGSSAGGSFAQVPLLAELSVICALVLSGQLRDHLQVKCPFYSQKCDKTRPSVKYMK